LAEAEFGRIWEKWPNFEFAEAEAEAEIRCNPSENVLYKRCFVTLEKVGKKLTF